MAIVAAIPQVEFLPLAVLNASLALLTDPPDQAVRLHELKLSLKITSGVTERRAVFDVAVPAMFVKTARNFLPLSVDCVVKL